MKITYPECQIEISVDEVITLIDHANLTDAGTQLVHEIEDYKEKLREELLPEGHEQVRYQFKKGSRPMTIEEMAEEMSKSQGMIGPDFDPMFPTVKVPKVVGLDEEPHPAPEPEPEPKPKQKSTRLKKPKKEPKLADIQFRVGKVGKDKEPDEKPDEKPKRKNKTNSKAVEVLLENGWKTFGSVSQAAAAIGTRLNHLSHALLNNKTCNGYQVRYAVDGKQQPEATNEEPTELP